MFKKKKLLSENFTAFYGTRKIGERKEKWSKVDALHSDILEKDTELQSFSTAGNKKFIGFNVTLKMNGCKSDTENEAKYSHEEVKETVEVPKLSVLERGYSNINIRSSYNVQNERPLSFKSPKHGLKSHRKYTDSTSCYLYSDFQRRCDSEISSGRNDSGRLSGSRKKFYVENDSFQDEMDQFYSSNGTDCRKFSKNNSFQRGSEVVSECQDKFINQSQTPSENYNSTNFVPNKHFPKQEHFHHRFNIDERDERETTCKRCQAETDRSDSTNTRTGESVKIPERNGQLVYSHAEQERFSPAMISFGNSVRNKKTINNLKFEGRTLLKGGVKPRHIPKTCIQKPNMEPLYDPRMKENYCRTTCFLGLPKWHREFVKEQKEKSLQHNANMYNSSDVKPGNINNCSACEESSRPVDVKNENASSYKGNHVRVEASDDINVVDMELDEDSIMKPQQKDRNYNYLSLSEQISNFYNIDVTSEQKEEIRKVLLLITNNEQPKQECEEVSGFVASRKDKHFKLENIETQWDDNQMGTRGIPVMLFTSPRSTEGTKRKQTIEVLPDTQNTIKKALKSIDDEWKTNYRNLDKKDSRIDDYSKLSSKSEIKEEVNKNREFATTSFSRLKNGKREKETSPRSRKRYCSPLKGIKKSSRKSPDRGRKCRRNIDRYDCREDRHYKTDQKYDKYPLSRNAERRYYTSGTRNRHRDSEKDCIQRETYRKSLSPVYYDNKYTRP